MNTRSVQYNWSMPTGFWSRLVMVAAGVVVFILALFFASVLFIAGAIALSSAVAVTAWRRRFARSRSVETVRNADIIEGQYEVLEDSKEEPAPLRTPSSDKR